MRLSIVLLAVGLAGCGSNWSGDPFKTLDAVPHWPDCDGDGWGDPSAESRCVSIGGGEVPEADVCPGSDVARYVENALDCDDGYAQSGADYTGEGCPSQFAWTLDEPVDETSYATFDDGLREFMVFLPSVLQGEAADICDAWAIGTPHEGEALLEDPGGVATLDSPEQQQTAEEAVLPFGEHTLWVDMRFSATDGSALVWETEGDTEIPVDLEYCDGTPFTLLDLVPIPEGVEGGDEGLARFSQSLLIPLRFGAQQPCVERPSQDCRTYDAIDPEADTTACPSFGVLCERPYARPSDLVFYRGAEGICDSSDEG